MNKLILFLVAVIFTSCSSYYYTATPQSYTDVAVVEPLEEEEVISSQIYPVITFTNWNVYSNYWNNYLYSPYYIAPSVAWSFNSPYNYTWSVSYWRPWRWNSWNNYYGWNSWNNYNYWGWNSWNNWYGYNSWYGWNSWNHNWYGFNSWNHPYNWYGHNNWNGCGNNYFFNNTYITNNYNHGPNGGKFFGPNKNTLGTGTFTTGKLSTKSDNYTSVPVVNNKSQLSSNSPIKPAKLSSSDRFTSANVSNRSNDIRNYQTSSGQVRQTSVSNSDLRNNDIRNYHTYSVSEKPSTNSDVRINNPVPVRVDNQTQKPERGIYTPKNDTRTYRNTYQPRSESRSNTYQPHSESRNSYQPRTETRSYQPRSESRNSYQPRNNSYSPSRNSYQPRQGSPSGGSRMNSPSRSYTPSGGSSKIRR